MQERWGCGILNFPLQKVHRRRETEGRPWNSGRIFDTIPNQFDRWRPRYCAQAFADIAQEAHLGPGAAALEIGPGTGQATEPILRTGCDYLGVELGEHLAARMREKFADAPNFSLVCGDFLEQELGAERFDLVLSAATIQWMDEKDAFPRCYALLKPGGVLAMLRLTPDYRTPNPALYDRIRGYTRRTSGHGGVHAALRLRECGAVRICGVETQEYVHSRLLDAEGCAAYLGTHCDHITLEEPDRTAFFEGIRRAVREAGDRIEYRDRVRLTLARRPR